MVIREGCVVEQCEPLKYLKGKILQKYPHLKSIAKLFFSLFLGCYKTSVRTTRAKTLEVNLNV